MADEMNLEIVLSAINETGSPFKEMDDSVKSFQSMLTDLGKTATETFGIITSAITTFTTSLESNMKDDSAALVDFGKSASDQTKVVEDSLSGASKAADDVAKSMSTAAADISKDMQEASKAVGEFEKTTETDLAGASQSMNGLRDNMNKGIDKIGGLLAIQMFGQSIEHLGKQGEKLFDYAITQGGDFEQTNKNIQTVIAANADGTASWNTKLQAAAGITDQLTQLQLKLGSRGAQSANEVGTAMDAMLRGGVDPVAILNGAAQAAQNVAIVTGGSIGDAADLMTNTYHEFRSEFEKNGKSIQQNMTDSGNVISGVLLSANISSTEFADTFKYVGPIAAQVGSSLLDAATATAVLARNGIDGTRAGTNLQRMFTNIIAPTKSGTAALKELGIIQNGHNALVDESTGKLKTLTEMQGILSKATEGLTDVKKTALEKEIFGQYALTGSMVMINQTTDEYGKLKDKIGNVDAEQAAAAMLDTFNGKMKQLEAHVATTAKEFGLSFIPELEKLLPIGQKILDWFQGLTPQTKELGMGLLAAGSAIAIIGGALATFAISAKFAGEGMKALQGLFMIQAEEEAAISVFKSFGMAVKEVGLAEAFMDLMSPMGWIALAVAAVIGLAFVITEHWGPIKEFISNLWTTVSTFTVKIFHDVIDFFKKWGLDILAVLLGPIGIIAKLVYDHWDAIKKFTVTLWNDIIGWIKDTWGKFVSWISDATTSFVNGVVGIWNGLITGIKNLWNGFTSWITNAAKAALQFVVDAFEWLYNHNYYFKDLVDSIVNAFNFIKKFCVDLWNGIKDFFVTLWADIKKIASDFWESEKLGFQQKWEAIVKVATDVWKKISDMFEKLWDGIKKIAGDFWDDEKRGFEKIWNAIVKVATDIFNPISDFFSGLWNGISKDAQAIWGTIRDIWNGLWNGVVGDAEGIFNGIGTFFTGLWNDALQWGENLINMVAQGISNAAQKVEDAVKGIAKKITSFLGFHSPTEEGPGADADQWAPNFIKMFAGGLAAGASDVSDAANTMISPLTGILGGMSGTNTTLGGIDPANADKIKNVVSALIDDKKRWAEASKNSDQAAMNSAHDMGEKHRAILQGMGVDTTAFAADKSINDALKGLDQVMYQVGQSVQAKHKAMTDNVITSSSDMSQSSTSTWSQMSKDITGSATKLRETVAEVFKEIENVVREVAMSMENALSNSFHGIVNDAMSAAAAVVSAVNQMKAALASVAGGGVNVSSSMSTSSTTSFAGMPMIAAMSPVMSNGGGGVVNNITVHANGNITDNNEKLGDMLAKAILDKMKQQGKV